ncbi:MAG: hypothetical protein QXQ58_02930 [Candidatus Aenigmatarchaeota archaeon]|nr:hypothetical protein [Candidatus Aenigmarchaeota archaeon]
MPHMYEYAIKIFLLLDDFKKRDKSKELLLQVCLGFLVTQVKKIHLQAIQKKIGVIWI